MTNFDDLIEHDMDLDYENPIDEDEFEEDEDDEVEDE